MIFKIQLGQFIIYLLPSIKVPLKFSTAFARRVVVESNGLEISFISLEDLIQDKAVDARPKDRDDIQNLRRLL
jgi:predicted nucleotidyltransferase